MVDVAEVNQWCYVEECGQWLENVDGTHPEASYYYKKKQFAKRPHFRLSCWQINTLQCY